MDKPAEKAAPKSTDLSGWRQAIIDNHLGSFKLEAIAAAFQDLRRRSDRDEHVEQGLIKYLSASILRILRKHVGVNHPNRGEDIIFRAHYQLITALLNPKSADGKGMREAFASRVLFRMKDALAAELRERRAPGYTPPTEVKKQAGEIEDSKVELDPSDDFDGEESLDIHAASEQVDESQFQDDEFAPRIVWRQLETDEANDICQQIDVDRVLDRINDHRKRLAFQLYLEDVPFKSKRPGVFTIAKAVGVSEKTARTWIQEIIDFLQADEQVLNLRRQKVGEKS